MKYYALSADLLAEYGIGDESWRKRSGSEVLVCEAEVIGCMGFGSASEFEAETGAVPMTLSEATEWTKNV